MAYALLVLAILVAARLLFIVVRNPSTFSPGPSPGGPEPATARLGEEFRLGLGDRVTITDTDLAVEGLRVEQDSRCPRDTACITAGTATVAVGASAGDRDIGPIRLTIGSSPAQAAGTIAPSGSDRYSIRLTALDPYPPKGQAIPAPAYTATLVVSGQ